MPTLFEIIVIYLYLTVSVVMITACLGVCLWILYRLIIDDLPPCPW